MSRIDAGAIITPVANKKSVRDVADKQLVGYTTSASRLSVEGKAAVAVTKVTAAPYPALIGRIGGFHL